MPLSATSGFTKELKKKIDKTREARNGDGIFKRRNRRDYRVIMRLVTYKKIYDQDRTLLDKYKDGFAVRVEPKEYFEIDGNKRSDFPTTLKLGYNAFIYFKTIESLDRYEKFVKNFSEVTELKTQPDKNNVFDSWVGEYCFYVLNTKPQKLSLICSTDYKSKSSDVKNRELEMIKKNYSLNKDNNGKIIFPAQAGLGNYEYDYASKEEVQNVCYQMSYLIYKVRGMKQELQALTNSSEVEMNRYEKHVADYCEENGLNDFGRLASIKSWDLEKGHPICPLCKKEITTEDFFKDIEQDEGREEEDNTQTAIELMHIKPLTPGEFNHCTYNLGWGHKHCNMIQGNLSISETLKKLQDIVKSNGMF